MREKDSLIGKLVVVAHWSDFKLEDATVLGILSRIDSGGYFYIRGSARGYRYMRPVSNTTYRRRINE